MSEHEILKEICDTIGYDYSKRYNFYKTLKKFWVNLTWKSWRREASIQEIIFTQEFMNKLMYYYHITLNWPMIGLFSERLLQNLDNPTTYLYNLLGLWHIETDQKQTSQ